MKRDSIEFVPARNAIRQTVTKFGGQPVWLTEACWPLSAQTGNPMRFICQVVLEADVFGSGNPKMAYLFMTEEDADDYVDGTWEPDGGENAVILQPGSTSLPVKALTEGPTLYQMVKKMFRSRLVPQPCEFAVRTTRVEDPEYAPEDERATWSREKWAEYANALDGNKIGGSPLFLQNDEFPGPGQWRLLLQLDSTRVPFYINFGDAGIGYAFISEDGTMGRFLWQCA